MTKHLISGLVVVFLLSTTQLHAQQADSAAMIKSQERIEGNLKDADKMQRKIDKKQHRIDKQQKRIKRQERKKDKKMRRIEKEQRRFEKASTPAPAQ